VPALSATPSAVCSGQHPSSDTRTAGALTDQFYVQLSAGALSACVG